MPKTSDKVTIIRPEVEVEVRLTFTESEFRGLYETVLGKGTMNDAWFVIRDAAEELRLR